MNSWIIIPARGGSKTIPRKNLALLSGRPLIDYVLMAVQDWGTADRVIVSTDDLEIGERAKTHGALTAGRPQHLCGDDVPIAAVISDLLDQDRMWPDVIILLQPTSPFVLPMDMDRAMSAFKLHDVKLNSFENIAEVPHNHHEYNQRIVNEHLSIWMHPNERHLYYNKQNKPDRYTFGNLLAFRPKIFMQAGNLFQYPRGCVEIPRAYAHDVDDQLDLEIAEAMIERGIIKLEHLR